MPRPELLGRRLRDWVPRWWRGEGGVGGRALTAVLLPAELLFRTAVAARNRGYDAGLLQVEHAPIPVVSVGNIGVGGAGKTPFAAWVAARFSAWGYRPGLVLRGYGADEILVHREINPTVPVFPARRRIEGVRQAARRECGVAVLDDAFQHRALARDLDLVLVGADGWDRRMRLLPRGPWREGVAALTRADLVVITRKACAPSVADQVEEVLGRRISRARIVRCRIAATGLVPAGRGSADGAATPIESLSGRKVLAVASLADPRAFVGHLAAVGIDVELAAFPDHHDFTPVDAAELGRRSGGRPLVMTRKEAVKLRGLLAPEVESWVVEQEVVIERGADVLEEALREVMRR